MANFHFISKLAIVELLVSLHVYTRELYHVHSTNKYMLLDKNV